uniref:Uncharacterized protein n=1 Tax=Arundo donax TaxID=35708 RepID=A0A0A9GZD5_ARUDO
MYSCMTQEKSTAKADFLQNWFFKKHDDRISIRMQTSKVVPICVFIYSITMDSIQNKYMSIRLVGKRILVFVLVYALDWVWLVVGGFNFVGCGVRTSVMYWMQRYTNGHRIIVDL